jgi:hypothetical protein
VCGDLTQPAQTLSPTGTQRWQGFSQERGEAGLGWPPLAFGSTEEFYRVSILGCKQVGHPSMAPFDHTTGKGYVARRGGQYADALRKGSRVISAIVETFGGITPHFLLYLGHLARRAKGRHGRDSTVYGRSRGRSLRNTHSACG